MTIQQTLINSQKYLTKKRVEEIEATKCNGGKKSHFLVILLNKGSKGKKLNKAETFMSQISCMTGLHILKFASHPTSHNSHLGVHTHYPFNRRGQICQCVTFHLPILYIPKVPRLKRAFVGGQGRAQNFSLYIVAVANLQNFIQWQQLGFENCALVQYPIQLTYCTF